MNKKEAKKVLGLEGQRITKSFALRELLKQQHFMSERKYHPKHIADVDNLKREIEIRRADEEVRRAWEVLAE